MSTRAWCERLIEGLQCSGVTDMVVSPGSRSTPLLLACLESSLHLHSVIDERSAAFFALGRARATCQPVAFLCTSGSGGAHALPALLEARYAEHRVIAITADRPPELYECGANQTIEQRMLFAAACPPCLDAGIPEASPAAALGLRRRVHQAVALASGPIHINLPFRKPLQLEPPLASHTPPMPLAQIQPPQAQAQQSQIVDVAALCASAKRGVIVAGPGSASATHRKALHALASATGFVLLAESTSGARLTGSMLEQRCDAFPHILAATQYDPASEAALAPDLILQVGAQPAGMALNRWLSTLACPVYRFAQRQLSVDPSGSDQLVLGDVDQSLERVCEQLSTPSRSSDYLRAWRKLDEMAWCQVASQLDTGAQLSEARAVATLLAALPKDTQLTLGNSMSIRSADMVLPGHKADLRILHQRGTSGIDGLIASAIGSSQSSFSALLLGDVAFAHDLSSLALASLSKGPLALLLLDNQGGQIFSYLPVAKIAMSQAKREMWTTPPSVDFAKACDAYQVPYRRVETQAELEAGIAWAAQQPGCVCLHMRVAPHSLLEFTQSTQQGSAP